MNNSPKKYNRKKKSHHSFMVENIIQRINDIPRRNFNQIKRKWMPNSSKVSIECFGKNWRTLQMRFFPPICMRCLQIIQQNNNDSSEIFQLQYSVRFAFCYFVNQTEWLCQICSVLFILQTKKVMQILQWYSLFADGYHFSITKMLQNISLNFNFGSYEHFNIRLVNLLKRKIKHVDSLLWIVTHSNILLWNVRGLECFPWK